MTEDTELRIVALGHAVQLGSTEATVKCAENFYNFLVGKSDNAEEPF